MEVLNEPIFYSSIRDKYFNVDFNNRNSDGNMSSKFLMTCKKCMDYDSKKEECLIRFTVLKDGTKIPMKRKPDQKGCRVFMYQS